MMGWAAVSASLYPELCTGLEDRNRAEANSCRVYMHRGLDVLRVSSPSSGATMRLSAAPVCSSSHLTKAGRNSERTSAVGFLTAGGATEQQAFHNNVKVVSPPLTPLRKTNKQDRE